MAQSAAPPYPCPSHPSPPRRAAGQPPARAKWRWNPRRHRLNDLATIYLPAADGPSRLPMLQCLCLSWRLPRSACSIFAASEEAHARPDPRSTRSPLPPKPLAASPARAASTLAFERGEICLQADRRWTPPTICAIAFAGSSPIAENRLIVPACTSRRSARLWRGPRTTHRLGALRAFSPKLTPHLSCTARAISTYRPCSVRRDKIVRCLRDLGGPRHIDPTLPLIALTVWRQTHYRVVSKLLTSFS